MSTLNAGEASAGNDIQEVGFAKLVGEEFEFYMQTYEIILGCNTKKGKVDLDLSVIGGGKDISHYHARVFYDFEKRGFFLEVLGKNGCTIQGTSYTPGDCPIKLKSQDLIQIGELKLYFLLPRCSISESLAAQCSQIPTQSPASQVIRPTNGPSQSPSSSVLRPAHILSESLVSSVMCRSHIPSQSASSSGVCPTHIPSQSPPLSSMCPAHIPTLFSSSFIRRPSPSNPYSSNSRGHFHGNGHGWGNDENGIRVGTATEGMLLNQSQSSFGELSLGPVNVEPVGTLDKHVNNGNIRTAKEKCNQQLQLKVEKNIMTCVATLLSNSCAPREWMPVEKLHSQLIYHFSKIWSSSKVQKYLTPEDGPSTGTIRKPWYNLLELLKKHPEHFVISTVCRGSSTSEFVLLDSLI